MKQWLLILTIALGLCFPSFAEAGNKKKTGKATSVQQKSSGKKPLARDQGKPKAKPKPKAKKAAPKKAKPRAKQKEKKSKKQSGKSKRTRQPKKRAKEPDFCRYQLRDGQHSLKAIPYYTQRLQNLIADREGLSRIADREELEQKKRDGTLVPLVSNHVLVVTNDLEHRRRFILHNRALCLKDDAEAHYAATGKPFRINSVVRPKEDQPSKKNNPNAAPTEGDTASLHSTGGAVDIAMVGNTHEENMQMARHFLRSNKEGRTIAFVECRGRKVMHVFYLPGCDTRSH